MLRGGVFQIVFCKENHVILRHDSRSVLPLADDWGYYPVPVLSAEKCSEVLLKYPRMVRFTIESFSKYNPSLEQVCTFLYYSKLLQRNGEDAADPDSFCTWSKSLNETVFSRWNDAYNYYRAHQVERNFGVSARDMDILGRYSSETVEEPTV